MKNNVSIHSELSNGSIFHKRLHRLYDIGEYEILHFENEDERRRHHQYKVCAVLGKAYFFIELPSEAAARLFKAATFVCMVCTGLHIFIYTSIKELRDLPSQVVLAMAVAYFPIQLLLALNGLAYKR